MKEYLVKNIYGEYKLTDHHSGFSVEDLIEIPDGATMYAEDSNMGVKDNYFFKLRSSGFDHEAVWLNENWMRVSFDVRNVKVLWFRESLNDKIATAEAARQESKSIDATLAERQSQYGSFTGVANTTGQLMAVIKNSPNGHTMPYAHEEALHMICSKIARIVNGDFNHLDSWHDIGGYSKLIEDLIAVDQ